MLAALISCVFAFQAPAGSAEIPLALRMAEKYRRDIGAADIRWRSVEYRDGLPPASDWRTPSLTGPIERRYHSQLAWNGDFAFEDLGDPDGVHQYDQQGNPVCITSRGFLIRKNREVWSYFRGTHAAYLWKDRDRQTWRLFCPVKDIRALGLLRRPRHYERLETDDVLRLGKGDSVFEEEILPDGIHKISRIASANGQRMIWYINPEKGWNPERLVVENRLGHELAAVEVVLERFGEVWFPRSCSTHSLGVLREYVEIERATFNDPKLKQLLPAVIGIEAGVQVTPQAGSLPPAPPPGGYVWDGSKLVGFKEWWAQVKKGKRMGPSMEYLSREGSDHIFPQGTLPRLDDLSDWERYVLSFIRKYKLSDEQSEKAWRIHRRCKERADQYLRNKAEVIARLESDLQKSRKDAELLKKRAALRQPIEDIFKQGLVRGLNRIPTTAQRERAEADSPKKAQTQPSSP